MPSKKSSSLVKKTTPDNKKHAIELLKIAEEAYYAGYMDAMIDMDEKAEAMDKYLEKALTQFEKEYIKSLSAPKKSSKKKKQK